MAIIDKISYYFSSGGLRKKFIFGAIGITFVMIVLNVLFVYSNLMVSLRQELKNHGIAITRNLSADAIDFTLTQDIVGLQRHIADVVTEENDVSYVYLVDQKRSVLAHTFENGFPAALRGINSPAPGQESSTRLLDTEDGYIWDFAVPILQDIGVVHVGLSENSIRKIAHRNIWIIIGITLIVLILGIALLAYFVVARVLRPLRLLSQGVRELSEGNFKHRMQINTKDEFGVVGTVFNVMVLQLEETISQLKDEAAKRRNIEEKIISLSRFPIENPNPVLRISDEGVILYKNKAVDEILTKAGFSGRDVFEVLPPNLKELVKRALKNGEDLHGLDIVIKNRIYSYSLGPVLKSRYVNIYGKDITDIRSLEKRARHLLDVVDSLDYSFYVVNPDYTIAFCNAAAREKGVVEGGRCYEMTHKRNRPCSGEHICPLRQVVRTKKPVVTEHIHYDKDGKERIVEVHGDPVFDEQGNVCQMIESSIDITERKQAELALCESDRRFQEISETVGEWIWEVDTKGIYTYSNSMVKDILGYSPEEIVGRKHFYDFFIPEEKEKLKAATFKAFSGKRYLKKFINKNLHKDGRVITIETSGNPMLDDAGKFIGYRGSDMDVTERIEAENRIKDALSEWDRTFNAITDWVFIQDANYIITKANKAFCSAMKMHEKDVIGKKCHEIIHHTAQHWPSCPLEKTRKDKKFHVAEVDDPLLGIPLLVTTSPIFDDKNNFIGVIHIATDISERKEAEKKLRQAIAMKSEFISTVSHELRTPLTSIKEGIAIVCDGSTGPLNKEQGEFLNMAKRNVDRLARLINDVLDLQKIDAGKMLYKMETNDLAGALNEVKATMGRIAEEKGLKFIVNIDSVLPKIRFDKDKIIQVLTNLAANAIKYTKKGSIVMSARKDKNLVFINVKDSGQGIKKSNMANLFRRFEQLEKGKERKTGGTGLGLAICKEIIEMHRGKIWVDSKYGKGSTFTFVLPVSERRT